MERKTAVKLLGAGGIVLGVALMVGSAWATNMFTGIQTCTTLNCNAATIQGTVVGAASNNNPWTAEIFATAGQCLRIAITSEGTDLETVVRAPNGQVFRNDDGGGACFLCPVVKINNTPNRGWYSVSVSHFAGSAVYADFTMRYQRYNINNPNCAGPTVPVTSPLDPDMKSQKGQDVSPQQQSEEGTLAP